MPIIEPNDKSIRRLTGIHLWHEQLSSCSQRVRSVLGAKNISWESHIVSILDGDNVKPEYLAINPKGLVPALVHDGVLMTESIDIIDYLDTAFGSPSLRPDDPKLVDKMKRWLDAANEAQSDLRILSHEFLFRAARKISDDALAIYENDVEDDNLVDFARAYHDGDSMPEDMVTACVNRTDERFRKLHIALDGRDWLVGDQLSLADIAWMPNAHRFELMDWPMERLSNLVAWHGRVKQLDAYKVGIVEWEPPEIRQLLTDYARTRGEAGHHVRNFGVLAEA